MRREFDEYLLRRSGESGTELRLGVSVKSIELSADRLNLSDGSEVRYKVLIGADGVNSQVSKTLFGSSFTPETIGFALEVEVPRGDLPDHGDVVEVEFSAASWGYGWVFPKKRTFTIGVGGVQARNPDMKENLREYLAAKDLDVTKYKVKGHFIPFGDFRTKPGAGNVLLCGDAAGVVDPITGEGIAYALETGLAAAQAAAAAIEAAVPKTAYQLYEPAYHRAVDSLVQANRWRRLIFPKRVQPLFEWAFRDAGTLQQGYLDILAGHKEYRDLYGLFVKQVGKAVIKPFRLLFRALRPGGGHGLGDSSNP
jgi:flavin-dependent dehydrogenase